MSDTDISKELVQKAAAGDRAAFEELYRTTCRAVYFTCLGFLKDEQEAQDVTQDVYLSAFEQLDTLEDAGKFNPWIYRMAANKSINFLKKKKPSLPGDEQLEDMEMEEDENFLPEEYALNADKREIVLKIMKETCSDVLYQTILLHYFNEFSITEIAEIMECPEGTVKYRLSVARAKVKEGVLRYEKKSGDKLYSVAVIPFLTTLFTAQMQGMQIPSFPLSFPGVIPKSTIAASSAKTGGRIMLKGLQVKIAVGVAAAVVVGSVAAVVTITNQRAEKASVGAQDESTLDVAGLEDSEAREIPVADTDVTGPDEDTLQDESEATDETESVEEVEAEDKNSIEENENIEPEEKEGTEPTAESEYTYTDMSATMYATQTVNVRTLPSTDGDKIGSLSTNQEIAVTGQCNETSWYRFEYNGQTAYVSNNYISDTKIEVAAADPAPEQAAPAQETASASTSTASSIPNASVYPFGVLVDMGGWSFMVYDWRRPEGSRGGGMHLGDGSTNWVWIYDFQDDEAVYAAIREFFDANSCSCPASDRTHGGATPLWDNVNNTYYYP